THIRYGCWIAIHYNRSSIGGPRGSGIPSDQSAVDLTIMGGEIETSAGWCRISNDAVTDTGMRNRRNTDAARFGDQLMVYDDRIVNKGRIGRAPTENAPVNFLRG